MKKTLRCGRAGQRRPKHRGCAVQSKPDRKKEQLAKLARKKGERRTHLRRKKKSAAEEETKQTLKRHFVNIHIRREHQRQHRKHTEPPSSSLSPRRPSPSLPPRQSPHPDPPAKALTQPNPPQKPHKPNAPTPNFGMSPGTSPWNSESVETQFARNMRYVQTRETYQSLKGQNDRMCLGQFPENGWKKQNAIFRDSITAQAEFKSRNRSKIGSLYKEIFEHKGTVPNEQNDPFRVLFPKNTPEKPLKTRHHNYP